MGSRPTSGTSSRSSTSSAATSGEVRAHSAIHVLKGAVSAVLGPKTFTLASAGVLRFRADSPLASGEVGKTEAAANRKVAEDAEILEFSMDRQEAEGHFGTGIYDLASQPGGEALLRMVRIPDWEASFCTQAHLDSTGQVGALRIDDATFDAEAKEVGLRFHLL